MKNLFLSALAFIAISFASCGGDSCEQSDITAAVEKITNAATEYTADPTSENCETYKTAIEAYMSDIKDCDGVTQATIDGYQTSLDALTCD